jgi:hypothetical protein
MGCEEKATQKVQLLSEANGTKEKVAKAATYQEKVMGATRYANQRTINDPVFERCRRLLQNRPSRIGRKPSAIGNLRGEKGVVDLLFSWESTPLGSLLAQEIRSHPSSSQAHSRSNPLSPSFQAEAFRYVLDPCLKEHGSH